jgi:hypothetical protein
MLFAAALLFASCDSGGGGGGENKNSDPTSITYTSTDDTGNKYELEIKAAGRAAAYTPKAGDSYILTIFIGATTSKSTGTVGAVTGLTITLKHTGEVEFTVTVSGSSIASFSAAIPVDSGGTVPKPEISKPVGGGTISGSYSFTDPSGLGSATITFSGGTSGTFTMNAIIFGMSLQASGTYTVAGNKITCTTTDSNDPDEIGNKDTFTIIDDNTISDDDHGDLWKKK